MLGAVVERRRNQGVQAGDEPVRRVVDAVRIGDMALHAVDRQPAGHAAAPADLDHVAERIGRSRLADDAGVEALRRVPQPSQHLFRAVDRDPLLVAGDQQADRAGEAVAARRHKPLGGGDERGDRPLHVHRAAAAQFAVAQAGGERLERPALDRPRGHDIGMPGEAQIGPALAEPCVEIGDRRGFLAVGAGIAEGETVADKAELFEPARDDVERPLVLRRNARPPDQLGGEFDGVDRNHNRMYLRFIVDDC